MSIVNVDEVKRDLSRYLEHVAQSEEVVIASAGKPIAKLVPYQAPAAPRVERPHQHNNRPLSTGPEHPA